MPPWHQAPHDTLTSITSVLSGPSRLCPSQRHGPGVDESLSGLFVGTVKWTFMDVFSFKLPSQHISQQGPHTQAENASEPEPGRSEHGSGHHFAPAIESSRPPKAIHPHQANQLLRERLLELRMDL